MKQLKDLKNLKIMYKLIIAGSRNLNPTIEEIQDLILQFDIMPDVIVSGTAIGVDQAGERYCENNQLILRKFPANWTKYNKSAGHIRNKQMAEFADGLIAIWDGKSSGTKNMIYNALIYNLDILVYDTSKQKTYKKKKEVNGNHE